MINTNADSIYNAGWDAAENSEPLGKCPYAVDTEEYKRWVQGWTDHSKYIKWIES